MADNDFTLTGTAEIGVGPEKRYSCTRGHVWYAKFFISGVRMVATPELGVEESDYCMKCVADLLREHVGRVREG